MCKTPDFSRQRWTLLRQMISQTKHHSSTTSNSSLCCMALKTFGLLKTFLILVEEDGHNYGAIETVYIVRHFRHILYHFTRHILYHFQSF